MVFLTCIHITHTDTWPSTLGKVTGRMIKLCIFFKVLLPGEGGEGVEGGGGGRGVIKASPCSSDYGRGQIFLSQKV